MLEHPVAEIRLGPVRETKAEVAACPDADGLQCACNGQRNGQRNEPVSLPATDGVDHLADDQWDRDDERHPQQRSGDGTHRVAEMAGQGAKQEPEAAAYFGAAHPLGWSWRHPSQGIPPGSQPSRITSGSRTPSAPTMESM